MRSQCHWWLALLLVGTGIATGLAETDILLPVADEIRVEALRAPISDIGHPLPLAASWSDGGPNIGFSQDWQMEMIAKGHYLLPWFGFGPEPDMSTWSPEKIQDYRESSKKNFTQRCAAPLREAARLHLPIGFLTGEWEGQLLWNKKYFDLPADQNPNVVTEDGKIQGPVSPFGPVAPWREVGVSFGKTPILHLLQQWYPDPPLVLFVHNNEGPRCNFNVHTAEKDRRYLQQYGKGTSDEVKSIHIAQGWEERYRALKESFVDQFRSADWKSNTLFVGYNTWGRPTGNRGRISLAGWDGGSPSYYVINVGDGNDFDFTFGSPQINWMGGPEILSEIYRAKPRFWFDLSIWDGNEPVGPVEAKRDYAKFGQTFPPERYGGFVQFGLWLLRPRVAREYRDWTETRARVESYFIQLIEAVDRVHTNPVLRAFWRKGELVPNKARARMSEKLPGSISGEADYFFLLDTDLDPPRPWEHGTALPVFSLALVKGQKPQREWLVYAHAPLGARRHVGVTLPDFGKVTLDVVTQSGSFYLLSEKTRQLTTILAGGPASVRVSVSTAEATVAPPVATKAHKASRPATHDSTKEGIAAGTKLIFIATDPYSPTGELTGFRWDFGDGNSVTGLKAEHAYQKNGRYIAEFTAANTAGTTLVKQLPVSVGQKPDPGLVVFYPPFKTDDGIMYDASVHSNHALRVGSRWVDDPERGSALEFSGRPTDFVNLANTRDINHGGPYTNRTVMLWFNAATTKPLHQILYAEGGYGSGLHISLEHGRLEGGAWATTNWPGTWISADAILTNHWYPVALVLRNATHAKPEPGDTDNLELYLNGKKAGAGVSGQLQNHVEAFYLGQFHTTLFPNGKAEGPGGHFAGRLGEVRVYNRALSPAEIAEWSKPKP